MMKRELMLAIFLTIALSAFVSAEITITQPQSVYSVGDKLDLDVKVRPLVDTGDFLIVKLICAGNEIEIYKNPLSLSAGQERQVDIEVSLDRFVIGNNRGNCNVRADYGSDMQTTRQFEISQDIEVSFRLDKVSYDPSESISITGNAKKGNGEQLVGSIEIAISELGMANTLQISVGNFSNSFTIPSDAPAGDYEINVRAFEANSDGEIRNEGFAKTSVKIRQVMKSVEVALDTQNVLPEEEISFKVFSYDQAGNNIDNEILTTISDPTGKEFETFIVKTEETKKFKIGSNYQPGYWKISAKINEFSAEKEFSVEEKSKVDFSLENRTLVVENTGNIPFSGPVEIIIGGVSGIKQIENLGVGQKMRYSLEAPNGQYEIRVGYGDGEKKLGTALLTGRAISVEEFGKATRDSILLIVLVILVILAGVAGIYYYKKKKKEKFIGKTSGSFAPSSSTKVQPRETIPSKTQNLISSGTKQESAIISVYLRNYQDLKMRENQEALSAVESALWKAKEANAKIYSDGDFRLIVLTPKLKKDTELTFNALRLASDIERVFNSYNKRAKMKVDFGISVSSGELIVESSAAGHFKFSSVDNTIVSAKAMSKISNGEIVLSEKLRRSNVGKIKATQIEGKNAWKLDKITDRSEHADYINKFRENNFKN